MHSEAVANDRGRASDSSSDDASSFPEGRNSEELVHTQRGSAVSAGAPFGGEQGVYTRWLFVPQLKGVVYFPRSSSNAWFLRTH